ncbi:AraC family transcriptional regulator [Vibrio splendidus]|uniref:helix-turn-helix domain-containing protein n=1 Tax=Vibrio splendidus TaxID=29497 RepID=UPI0024689B3C|nr:AraC family transcriptional regulator [Vibrio splendidus]MDH5914411.1 AraC family transcriptional regulator [Vibrio splendidus]MDH5943742.1 AraC family transcriptional regulator [Vibrio splendidus]MDH5983375.1 AraC family transcriptional regulator [Vibrio splendidus]MDH5995579.1 AraC family transcriptional regulator [Vibrio splendidus]MDH6004040.1 AraC family transcriptional regulator [Vibrio splendidus]
MIIILKYDRVVIYKFTDDLLMQKRTDVMRNGQMGEVTSKQTKLAETAVAKANVLAKKSTLTKKIALTKKLEQTEKQIIVTQGQTKQTSLAEGKFLSYQYNDQIFVHGGRCVELVDSNIVSTAHSAILITILLEGKLTFGYDDLEFDLDANSGPQGVVVNLAKPANFRRSLIQGNKMNKINILVKPQWVEPRLSDHCSSKSFLDSHKAFYNVKINADIIQLTNALTSQATPTNFQDKLVVETLTQQLLAQTLSQMPIQCCQQCTSDDDLTNTESTDLVIASHNTNSSVNLDMASTSKSFDAKIEDIISYIEINLDQQLSLESIASKFSMSISNLQRRFKQSYNLTINGYIRYRRLDIARQHLERGLVSITEAAYEAGYQHPSNFTSAFKKTFGVPPQDIAV